MTRLLAKTLRVLLVGFVFLELALQALSIGAHVTRRSANSSSDGDEGGARTVLCLGDSFTYGFGATNGGTSYPGRLEARLNARPNEQWRVVNSGFPGKNSAHALSSLGYHLENLNPNFVIVLTGANDTWSRPDRIESSDLERLTGEEPESEKFQWRFRTLRLLQTLRRKNAFFSDSVASRDDEEIPPYPFPLPDDLPEEEVARRLETFRLLKLGNRAVQAGRLKEAESLFQQISDEHRVNRIGALIPVINSIGDRARAEELIQALIDLGNSPAISRREASVVASSITHAALFAEGRATLVKLGKQFPGEFNIALSEALCLFNLDLHEEARSASNRAEALRILPENEGHWASAQFLRTRSGLFRELDPDEQARCQAAAFLEDEDRALTIKSLSSHEEITEQRWKRVVDRLAATEDQKSNLYSMLAEARQTLQPGNEVVSQAGTQAATMATLRHHLDSIAQHSLDSGAQVIIGTYPFLDQDLLDAQSDVAQSRNLVLVDCAAAITEEARESNTPRGNYFIADGHCNDAGYEVMAEAIHAAMLPMIDR